jgi:RNA polymerase sigma factor (TIGR02999 family)
MHDDLDEAIYRELHAAAKRVRSQGGASTLQSTALVLEAWLKLSQSSSEIRDRGHFLAVATLAMRQILVDRARARASDKRGGAFVKTTLQGVGADAADPDWMLSFDAALTALAEVNEDAARVTEMRVIAGARVQEVVDALGIPTRTVERLWRLGRAFVGDRLR